MDDTDNKREEFIKEHLGEVEQDHRWVMLRDEVSKAENLELTDEEFDNELGRMAEMSEKTVDDVRKQLEEAGTLSRLRDQLFERKVIDFLVINAEVVDRKMSLDDFFKHSH